METKYYIHKRVYENFSNLVEVTGISTKVVFTVKNQRVIFGGDTWDIRIPKDTSNLFDSKELAIKELVKRVTIQLEEVNKEIFEVNTLLDWYKEKAKE